MAQSRRRTVVLSGNLSEGYQAWGPFSGFDEADEFIGRRLEGTSQAWITTLHSAKPFTENGTAVAITGNLDEGFRVFGPYKSYDDAAKRGPSNDVWIMSLMMID